MIEKIVQRKINNLKPYSGNPRVNKSAVKKVAESIQNFGFNVPLIITAENEIVTGHTRLKAAKNLGMESIPCIIISNLSPEKIKAFRIADNKVAEESKWDFLELARELDELDGFDDIKLSETGFGNLEIENIRELLKDEEIVLAATDKVTTKSLSKRVRATNNIVICPHCNAEIPLKLK